MHRNILKGLIISTLVMCTLGVSAADIKVGDAKGAQAIAIGESSEANGDYSVVVGGWASDTDEEGNKGAQATVVGLLAKATKNRATAIGAAAQANGIDATAVGTSTKALGDGSLALGRSSEVAKSGARGIAIGVNAYVGEKNDKHSGMGMPKPSDEWVPGKPYTAVNDDTKPNNPEDKQENAMAIGMKASAFGYQTTAVGAAAEAHDTNSTAVGVAAVARGNYSTALGKQARTYGKETTSVGHWADTRAEFATAVGANSIAYKKGSTAFGSNAKAYDENSVAIGANSIAKEAVDGKAVYSEEVVKASAGIVSMGNPNYKVGDEEVEANYRRVVNIAGGIHDHDAVNVMQLKALDKKLSAIGGGIGELGGKMNKVGAGAAALAALHPQDDFDAKHQWDFAAGVGNYNGANAIAIGAFYRPNEKTLVSLGGTFGNGENMLNAGVSIKCGRGKIITKSRREMSEEIEKLETTVQTQQQEINELKELVKTMINKK